MWFLLIQHVESAPRTWASTIRCLRGLLSHGSYILVCCSPVCSSALSSERQAQGCSEFLLVAKNQVGVCLFITLVFFFTRIAHFSSMFCLLFLAGSYAVLNSSLLSANTKGNVHISAFLFEFKFCVLMRTRGQGHTTPLLK